MVLLRLIKIVIGSFYVKSKMGEQTVSLVSFCFKLRIDKKGLMRWLRLAKLLWVKKIYYENEGLAWDCVKVCKMV